MTPANERFDSLGGVWTDGSGVIFIGKDWNLQNDILEAKERTKARSCYKECRSCGCCSNSVHEGSGITSCYDENEGKMINCRNCEKFRFCDCRNGFFRNARGDAEPFTPDVIAMLKETGGRPLI